jgi:hypothetical protein
VIAPYGPELAARGSHVTPVLVVDDRPGENAPPGDVAGWQCRIDVRAPLTEVDVAQYAGADALVSGPMSVEVAAAVAEMFELTAAGRTALARLGADHAAVVQDARVRVARYRPEPGESDRLRAPRPTAPAAPAWPAQPAFPGPTPTGSIPALGGGRSVPAPTPAPSSARPGAVPAGPPVPQRVGPGAINAGTSARPPRPSLPPPPPLPPRRPAPAEPLSPPPRKPTLPPPPARPEQRPEGPRHAQ